MEPGELDDRIRKYALELAIITKNTEIALAINGKSTTPAATLATLYDSPFLVGVTTALNKLYTYFPSLEQTISEEIERHRNPATGFYGEINGMIFREGYPPFL